MKSLVNKEILIPILIRFAIYSFVMGMIFVYKSFSKYYRNTDNKYEIVIRDIDSYTWNDGEYTVIDNDGIVSDFWQEKTNTSTDARKYEIGITPQKAGVFFVLMSYSDPEKKRWDLYRVEVDDYLNYKIDVKKDMTKPFGVPRQMAVNSLLGRSFFDDIPKDLYHMKKKEYLDNWGSKKSIYFSDEGYLYSLDFDLNHVKNSIRVTSVSDNEGNNLCYKFVPDEWCDVEAVLKLEGVN